MEPMRRSFQGVTNIIKFNWPYFAGSVLLLIVLLFLNNHFIDIYSILAIIILLTNFVALATSHYIYDRSSLYDLTWLKNVSIGNRVINITAGFDETSLLLHKKFPGSNIQTLDFYDPEKHTEPSIKRARKAYPLPQYTLKVNTTHLPFDDRSIDTVFAIFSLHEIRNPLERKKFFQELNRVIVPNGNIIIVEHLRDAVNFMAYNVGFFHFHSKKSWFKTFTNANLHITQNRKITPFVTAYILKKYETES
jgi:ubiquinone/menaquinone biosynthesis C-methylase UbiE